jgi:DNA-binding winged helix-turn-helix (wHTH) protein
MVWRDGIVESVDLTTQIEIARHAIFKARHRVRR